MPFSSHKIGCPAKMIAQSAKPSIYRKSLGGCKAMANSPQTHSFIVDAVFWSCRGLQVKTIKTGSGWNGCNAQLFGVVLRCSF